MIPKDEKQPVDGKTKVGIKPKFGRTSRNRGYAFTAQTPFLYMGALDHTPSMADEVAENLEYNNHEAQILFEAEVA